MDAEQEPTPPPLLGFERSLQDARPTSGSEPSGRLLAGPRWVTCLAGPSRGPAELLETFVTGHLASATLTRHTQRYGSAR